MDGKHLMRFQSESAVYKFLWRNVVGPGELLTFPGGILPVVSRPTARKRPNATVYATALLSKRIQTIHVTL